jgi:hypothetical protein
MHGTAPNIKLGASVNAMLQQRQEGVQTKHSKVLVSITTGATVGAITGTCVAVLLISLANIRPFSSNINSLVERATFKLCPFYILGFANSVSKIGLIAWTIIGNAILYGMVFAVAAAIFFLHSENRCVSSE